MGNLRIILATILLCFGLRTFAQEHTIKVVDFKSNETIPFAHVCFEELDSDSKYYMVTTKDGIANIPGNRELIVAVSFVGYKAQIDTIKPGRDYTFKLYPKVFDIDQVVVTANFTPQKAD